MTNEEKATDFLAKLKAIGEGPEIGDDAWGVIDIHDHVETWLGVDLDLEDTDLFGVLLVAFNKET